MPRGEPFEIKVPSGGKVTFYLDFPPPGSSGQPDRSKEFIAACKALLANAEKAAAADSQSGWALVLSNLKGKDVYITDDPLRAVSNLGIGDNSESGRQILNTHVFASGYAYWDPIKAGTPASTAPNEPPNFNIFGDKPSNRSKLTIGIGALTLSNIEAETAKSGEASWCDPTASMILPTIHGHPGRSRSSRRTSGCRRASAVV
jgi:hypothetical protein